MWTKMRIRSVLFSAVLALMYIAPLPGWCQCDVFQIRKITASDGELDDRLGSAVALRGNIALMGAINDDDAGLNGGSAYLFDVESGAELFKLLPNYPTGQARFGAAVALSATLAAVGAPDERELAIQAGATYLFETRTGTRLSKLTASDGAARDHFGSSVGLGDGFVLVGAPLDDDFGEDTGSVYVFDVSDPTNPLEISKFNADDPTASALFGIAIAIRDRVAIIGSSGLSGSRGSAYLFDVSDPSSPRQLIKLRASDGDWSDNFGFSVAIGERTAVVGAYGDDDNGSLSGSAYLFDVQSGMEVAKLLPEDGEADDRFGRSVAIDGRTVVVGAFRDDEIGVDSGSAYLFDLDTAAQIRKILPDDPEENDQFGSAAAIDDGLLVVGAHYDMIRRLDNVGSAYVFRIECDLTLGSIGACPGSMLFKVTRATPGETVALLTAPREGEFSIPSGNPCAGTLLGLKGAIRVATTKRAGTDGSLAVPALVTPQVCGRVYLQALDVSSCRTSNMILVE